MESEHPPAYWATKLTPQEPELVKLTEGFCADELPCPSKVQSQEIGLPDEISVKLNTVPGQPEVVSIVKSAIGLPTTT